MVARTAVACGLLVLGVAGVVSLAGAPPGVRGLVASFRPNSEDPDRPLLIRFEDTSAGRPISWRWDFGDGSPEERAQSPAHTYGKEGAYPVKLTVADRSGATATKTASVTVPLEVRFEVRPGKGSRSINLVDKSAGLPTSWSWDFGDGTARVTTRNPRDVAKRNPTHTYSQSGTYPVRLTITTRTGLTMSAMRMVAVPR